MKHVVVIGGGFAGLMALKQLIKSKKLKLTLINKHDYFLFTPRLTELLNKSVNMNIVIKNINEIFGNKVNFVNEEAYFIDLEQQYVKAKNKKIPYDYLIISCGAKTNFFGNKGIEKNTIDYKDYDSVLKIKEKINENIIKYSKNRKKEYLAFAVIGAGLTGIELICSLRETVLKELKNYPSISQKEARFAVIQSPKAIAPNLNPKTRLIIENHFRKHDIEMITETKVEKIENNVIVAKNKKFHASTIIWTAGIKANPLKTKPELTREKNDTIKVTKTFKIPEYDSVYVAGDTALFLGNTPLAPTAQTAFQEGIALGKNILRRIRGKKEKPFHYFHKGTLIVLGCDSGILNYKSFNIKGKLAWYLRDLIYRIRFRQIT